MAKAATVETTETTGWTVKVATLHQAVPMANQTEKTISKLKYPGIKMTWAPQGLICEIKGRTFVIAAANVAVAELE